MANDAGTVLANIRRPEAVILCVDEAARDAIAYWLNESQVDTAVARDGYEATNLLTVENARLLVTDRILPPWPGLSTFRALKSAYPKLRVAFVEDGIPDSHITARVSGADLFLPRPLRRSAVLALAQLPSAAE